MSDISAYDEFTEIIDNSGTKSLIPRKGTIIAATANNTATVKLGGSSKELTGIPCLGPYAPTVGDTVLALKWGGALWIIGKIT